MILKIIKILLSARFVFLPPKKNNVLIFDYQSSPILRKIFKINKFSILHIRKEEINLYVLLMTILNFKLNYFDYIINFIKCTEAKLIITSIDNNSAFYKIKSKVNVKTIFFQIGRRTAVQDVFSILRSKHKKEITKDFEVDLMNVFDHMTSKNYLKLVKGKTNIAGSIFNNDKKVYKGKKKPIITIISNWRREKIVGDTMGKMDELLKILKDFAEENNLVFSILGKYKNDLLADKNRCIDEKKYFTSLLGNEINFIPNSSNRNTYKLLDISKLVISTGSTLGSESLSRKNKTLILIPYPNRYPLNRNFFTYFTGKKKKGPFWYNGFNKSQINRLLKKVLAQKYSSWNKCLRLHLNEIPHYDYRNKKLKKTLKSFFKKNNIASSNIFIN